MCVHVHVCVCVFVVYTRIHERGGWMSTKTVCPQAPYIRFFDTSVFTGLEHTNPGRLAGILLSLPLCVQPNLPFIFNACAGIGFGGRIATITHTLVSGLGMERITSLVCHLVLYLE